MEWAKWPVCFGFRCHLCSWKPLTDLIDNLMVVDPIWAQAIKDLVKQRAADQQARAIAQSMINRERGLAV
jgi:hypothetical protein